AGVRLILQLPGVLGIEGDIAKQIKPLLPLLRDWLQVEEENEDYRDFKINGRKLKEDSPLYREANTPNEKEPFIPRFYYAEIDENFYFSFRKEVIKQLIDRNKDGKRETKLDANEPLVSAALLAVPHAAPDAREAVNQYLEWQTHRRALPGNAVWHAL